MVVIAGAGTGGGATTTSGGGTKDGGGGANFGGGGRFSGGGGGGFTSSMILVSIGALMTSTTLRARPLTSAQPSRMCIDDDDSESDGVLRRVPLLPSKIH